MKDLILQMIVLKKNKNDLKKKIYNKIIMIILYVSIASYQLVYTY